MYMYIYIHIYIYIYIYIYISKRFLFLSELYSGFLYSLKEERKKFLKNC